VTPIVARRGSNDTLLLWFASLVLLVAGYGTAVGIIGAAIDTQHQLTAGVVAARLANAALLEQRPRLEAAERDLAQRATSLELEADRPTTVARFLRLSTRVAAAAGAHVGQIEDVRSTAPPTELAERDGPAFEPINLDVTLHGTYRALVATIRALAQSSLTMQIEVVAIERDGTTDRPDALTAHLAVVLEHVARLAPPELPTDHRSPLSPEDVGVHARSD
jgi:hypothetical protein